jgi:hypothetical protein
MAQPRYRIQMMNPGTWEPIEYFEETISVNWSRKANSVGDAKIVVPHTLPITSFPRNTRILIWREKDDHQHLAGQTIWIVRKITQDLENGLIEFMAKDATILIENRVVGYTTATFEADKTAAEAAREGLPGPPVPLPVSDDMIKVYIDENMGTAAIDTTRDLVTDGYLSIEDQFGYGAFVEKTASFQNLLTTIQDIAKQSDEAGVPIYFDMVPDIQTGSFIFRTYTNFLGRDRSSESDDPLVFSQELENISKVQLEFDYTTEYNYLYFIGLGQTGGEIVEEYSNDASLRADPYSRRELVYKDEVYSNEDGLMDTVGPGILRGATATVNMKGRAIDTPLSRYGVDFEFGDKVSARAGTYEFDCFVEAVAASYSNGEEKLDIKLSSTVPVLI